MGGTRAIAVAIASALPLIAAGFWPPVAHGPEFHRYADHRMLLGIPHALDVLSNLPFVIAGLFGLVAVAHTADPLLRRLGTLYAVAVVAIGVGSGLYHLAPSDATLVFDWIPIALALMWLVALLAADRVDRRLAVVATAVLPLIAIASVVAWYAGGGTAGGDMRWYGLVQLEGVLLVPVLLLAYPRGALRSGTLWAALACFVSMRICHAFDAAILDATGVISGHSLKHLVAALAAYLALRSIPSAQAVVAGSERAPLTMAPPEPR